jgi:hypothetical protein
MSSTAPDATVTPASPAATASAGMPAMPARPHTKWRFTVLFGILGALVVGLVVLAFVWPIATATAKDLPVAISGPAASVAAVEKAVDADASGVIDFRTVSGRDAAVTRIEDRRVSGAIILPSTQGEVPEVLTASAGSTAASQLLNGLAGSLQAQLMTQAASAGAPSATVAALHVKVTDVVPLASTDKNGTGLIAASFPLVLGGLLGGILISLLVVGVVRRLLALVIYALAAGTVVGLILQPLFGILHGVFVVDVLALSLSMLATSSIVVGFNALLGPRGIAVGSVITMLIGNPIAGASIPPQFLVGPWGAVGQYFVPGAASALVRDLSYFPHYDAAPQWLILAGWAVLGLVMSVTGHFRSQAPIALPPNELDAESTVLALP